MKEKNLKFLIETSKIEEMSALMQTKKKRSVLDLASVNA